MVVLFVMMCNTSKSRESAVACTVASIAPPADDGDNHHVQQQGGSSNDNGHDDSVQLYTRMFPTFTWTIPDDIDPWSPSIPQEPDVQFCDLETNWHFSFEAFRALAFSWVSVIYLIDQCNIHQFTLGTALRCEGVHL